MEFIRPTVGALVAALVVAPLVAGAQAPAAPAAAANPLGPPIPGICVFARDIAFANSKAGQATDARLRVLTQQVQTELTPESQAIVAENNAINAPGASLTALQRQTRTDALQKRANAFEQLRQLRAGQLQQTRAQAVDTVLQRMSDALAPIASQRRCSIIVERNSTYGSNAAMDVTPSVIQALDARSPTVTFDLAPPASVKR